MRPLVPPIYATRPAKQGVAGSDHLLKTTWSNWSLLALSFTLLGVIGRLTGQLPEPAVALDVLGLGFWLCGPRLAQGWARLLKRQWFHRPMMLKDYPQLVRNAWLLLLLSYPLVLTGAGLLLAYGAGTELATVKMEYQIAMQMYTQRLLLGPTVLLTLLVCGPLLLIGSTLLYSLLEKRWGAHWGSNVWLMCGLLLNVPLFINTGFRLAGWNLPEHSLLGWFYQRCNDVFTIANREMTFMEDLLLRLLIVIAASMLGTILITVAVQLATRHQHAAGGSGRVKLSWLTALVGIVAPLLYTTLEGVGWTQAATVSTIGDWRAPFVIGIAAILCVVVALGPAAQADFRVWLLLCPVGWVLLSTPYIHAGLATHAGILGAAVFSWGCLLVLSPLLITLTDRHSAGLGSSIACGAALVLLLAWPGDSGTPFLAEMVGAVGTGLLVADMRPTALLILGSVLITGGVFWLLFAYRPLRKRCPESS